MMSLISKSSKQLRSFLGFPAKPSDLPVEPSEASPETSHLLVEPSESSVQIRETPVLEPSDSPVQKQHPPLLKEHTKMAIDFGKLNSVLQNFVTATPDIQGAAIVTPDGLPLASSLPGSLNEERVAAMSAAMLSLGERIASELSRGNTDRIFLEGETGYAILTSCGEDAVFLVMASKAAKQGVLMLEIKQVVGQIKSALDRQLSAVA
jgi:uncharacterized protein